MIEKVMGYRPPEGGEEKLLIGWDTVKGRPVLARAPVIEDEGDLLRLCVLALMFGAAGAIPVSFGMYMLLRWLGV